MIFSIGMPTGTQVGVPQPMLPLSSDTAIGVGSLGLVVGLAVLWLRRRISRDGLEIAKDRAEGGMVNALLRVNDNLTKENERLMVVANEAWSVRNADAKRIATLETQLAYMRKELEAMKPMVRDTSRALQNSGLMPLEFKKND